MHGGIEVVDVCARKPGHVERSGSVFVFLHKPLLECARMHRVRHVNRATAKRACRLDQTLKALGTELVSTCQLRTFDVLKTDGTRRHFDFFEKKSTFNLAAS